MPFLPTLLTAALGIALMLLPHHRRPLTRDRTLLATLAAVPSNIASDTRGRRPLAALLFHLATAAGCLAPLAPAILTLLLALTPPPSDPASHSRLILGLAAPLLFLLAALCTAMIYLSGLVIAFGSPGRSPLSHSGTFTIWYLFCVALAAALAAFAPDHFAGMFRFAVPA
jgi:hypothetical protein